MSARLCISTFSLVARDPDTKDLGIAMASKFLAVGFVVPWAKAGVGALATQSYANPHFGPMGLALMEAGAGPEGKISYRCWPATILSWPSASLVWCWPTVRA